MVQTTTAPAGAAQALPDIKISVRQTFGIDTDWEVPAFSRTDEHVPEFDTAYRFDRDTTLAILAGFAHDRRTLIQGYHGTGKSTHIERWRRASTGRASGSTSTRTSAASTSSARTRSCCARVSR